MTFKFTPIDELRALVDKTQDGVMSKGAAHLLKEERYHHVAALDGLSTETRGRERLADEQRAYDKHNDSVTLIDRVLLNYEKYLLGWADVHNTLARTGSGGTTSEFGTRIREAVLEVRDGRAMSIVEFPETRAMSESGSGGYGVTTAMGDPVFSLAAKSVVMSIPGVQHLTVTEGDRLRLPRFNAVTVGGTAEGAALTAAATDLDAVDVIFQKFSTYETLSTELEEDFSAPVMTLLGQRMMKDLAIRVDNGLLQGTGAADVVGIFNQVGVSSTSVAALPADFDKVDEALYQLALNDGEPGAWIMHPRTWRIYSQIKTGITSDKTTLLQPDPQQAAKSLKGLPVFTTSTISILTGATSVGSIAAVIDPSQIVVVTRRAPRLEISRDVAFSTDQIAIRATTRIGLGVLDAAGGISLLTDIRAS